MTSRHETGLLAQSRGFRSVGDLPERRHRRARSDFRVACRHHHRACGCEWLGKIEPLQGDHGFLTPTRGMVTLSGKPVREALKSGLVAYVPQAEEVDWTFPVLVEDVVMMGRYGRMNLMRIPRGGSWPR